MNRLGKDARAIMVGDLDGSGMLGRSLTVVGSPRSGDTSALKLGDIAVSLRGNTNYASAIEPGDLGDLPLFATLDLAVIRLRDPEAISAQYLATWLNLPATQQVLAGEREGSVAKRLPIGALRDLRVPLPPYSRQRAILELARAAAEERRLATCIAQLRGDVINELLRQAAAEGPALDKRPSQASTGPNGPGTTGRAFSHPLRKEPN